MKDDALTMEIEEAIRDLTQEERKLLLRMLAERGIPKETKK